MTTFHSGTQGKAVSEGIDLPVTRWRGAFTAERIDVTNAGSGGFAEYIPGVLRGEIELTLLWDSDELPNEAPGLVEGGIVTVSLFCGASGRTFTGDVLISSVGYHSRVRQVLTVAIGGVFTGEYQRPTSA